MLVFFNGKKFEMDPQVVIGYIKEGRFTRDTEVEFKGKIHKLGEFKNLKVYFEEYENSISAPPILKDVPPIREDEEIEKTRDNEGVNDSTSFSSSPEDDSSRKFDVEGFMNREKAKKRRVFAALSWFLALVLCCGVGFGIFELFAHFKKEKELYNTAFTLMLDGETEAEACCTLINKVWYNTIHEKRDPETDKYTMISESLFYSDFNSAVHRLQRDESFKQRLEKIEENQTQVAEVMKTLQKHTMKRNQECFDSIMKQYTIYSKMIGLAENPSGTVLDYGKSFNDADKEFADNLQLLKLYMD